MPRKRYPFSPAAPQATAGFAGKVLILGWSRRLFPILDELALARPKGRRTKVVILSEVEVEHGREQIKLHTKPNGRLKIKTFVGNPARIETLETLKLSTFSSVIVLYPENPLHAGVVHTVLALQESSLAPGVKIVAEATNSEFVEDLMRTSSGRVIPVRSDQVAAKVIAQSSRQPGLSEVFLDLLDFAGDEIYFTPMPALAGKTYGDALLSFNTASVIGLSHENGVVDLNPSPSAEILKHTRVISIAQDDTKIHFTGIREELVSETPPPKKLDAQPERIAILGWSETGRLIVEDLIESLPDGSSIQVFAQSNSVSLESLQALDSAPRIQLNYETSENPVGALEKNLEKQKINEILILAYRDGLTRVDADALTVRNLAQLKKVLSASPHNSERPRLVAELLDRSHQAEAQAAGDPDLLVNDDLASYLIAQLSQDPSLSLVFDELFGAKGPSLEIRDIGNYATVGKETSFAQLVANARARGESAIGYRVGDENTTGQSVKVNPDKDTMFTPKATDGLVVVADTVR